MSAHVNPDPRPPKITEDEIAAHVSDASRCMHTLQQPVAQSTIEGLIDGIRSLRFRAVAAERDASAVRVALAQLREAAEITFRGPSHSNAWHLRQAAARLDKGYQLGGGNTTAAVVRILRIVADLDGVS